MSDPTTNNNNINAAAAATAATTTTTPTPTTSTAASDAVHNDWKYAAHYATAASSNGDPDLVEESAGACISELHPFPPCITTSVHTIGDAAEFLVQFVSPPSDVCPPCPARIVDSILQQLRSLRRVSVHSLELAPDDVLESDLQCVQLKYRTAVSSSPDPFVNLSPSRMPVVVFTIVFLPTAGSAGLDRVLQWMEQRRQSDSGAKCYFQILVVSPNYEMVPINSNSNSSSDGSEATTTTTPTSATNKKNSGKAVGNNSNSNKKCVIKDAPNNSAFVHVPWGVNSSSNVENATATTDGTTSAATTKLIGPSQLAPETRGVLQQFSVVVASAAVVWASGRLRSLASKLPSDGSFFATAIDDASFSLLTPQSDKLGRLEMRAAKYRGDLHLLLGRPDAAMREYNRFPQLTDHQAACGAGDFLWICSAFDTICAIRWVCLRGVLLTARRDLEWIFENRRCFTQDQPPPGFEVAKNSLAIIWDRWAAALRINERGQSTLFPRFKAMAVGFMWSCISPDGTMPTFEGTLGAAAAGAENSASNAGNNAGAAGGGGGQQQQVMSGGLGPNLPGAPPMPPRNNPIAKGFCVPAREFDNFLTNILGDFEFDLKNNIITLSHVGAMRSFAGSDKIAAAARLEAESRLLHFLSLRCAVQPNSVYGPRVLLSACRSFVTVYSPHARAIAMEIEPELYGQQHHHHHHHHSTSGTNSNSTRRSQQANSSTRSSAAAATTTTAASNSNDSSSSSSAAAINTPGYQTCLQLNLSIFRHTRAALAWMLRRAGLHRTAVEFLRECLTADSSTTVQDPMLLLELWTELLRWVGINVSAPLSRLAGSNNNSDHRPFKFSETVLPDVANASPNRLNPITGDIVRSFVEASFGAAGASSPITATATPSSSSATSATKRIPSQIATPLSLMRVRAATLALLRIDDTFLSQDGCVAFFKKFLSKSPEARFATSRAPDECGSGLTVVACQMKKLPQSRSPQPFRCSGYMEGAFPDDYYFAKIEQQQQQGATNNNSSNTNNNNSKIIQVGPIIWVVDEVCTVTVELHNSFVTELRVDRAALHSRGRNVGIAFDCNPIVIPPQHSVSVDLLFQPVIVGEAVIDGLLWSSAALCGNAETEFFAELPQPIVTPVMDELPCAELRFDPRQSGVERGFVRHVHHRVLSMSMAGVFHHASRSMSMTFDGGDDSNGGTSSSLLPNRTGDSSTSLVQQQQQPQDTIDTVTVTVFQGQRVEVPVEVVNVGGSTIPLIALGDAAGDSNSNGSKKQQMWYSTLNATAHGQHCQLRHCLGCATFVQLQTPSAEARGHLRALEQGQTIPTKIIVNPRGIHLQPHQRVLDSLRGSGSTTTDDTTTTSGAHRHENNRNSDASHNNHNQHGSSNSNNNNTFSTAFSTTVRLEVFASKEPPFAVDGATIAQLRSSCPNVFCHLPARTSRLNLKINVLPGVRVVERPRLTPSRRLHITIINDNREWPVRVQRAVGFADKTGATIATLSVTGDDLCGPGLTQTLEIPIERDGMTSQELREAHSLTLNWTYLGQQQQQQQSGSSQQSASSSTSSASRQQHQRQLSIAAASWPAQFHHRSGKTEVLLDGIRDQITDGISVADLGVNVSVFLEEQPSLTSPTVRKNANNGKSNNNSALTLLRHISHWQPRIMDAVVEAMGQPLHLEVLGCYQARIVVGAPAAWTEQTSFEAFVDVPGGALLDGITRGILDFQMVVGQQQQQNQSFGRKQQTQQQQPNQVHKQKRSDTVDSFSYVSPAMLSRSPKAAKRDPNVPTLEIAAAKNKADVATAVFTPGRRGEEQQQQRTPNVASKTKNGQDLGDDDEGSIVQMPAKQQRSNDVPAADDDDDDVNRSGVALEDDDMSGSDCEVVPLKATSPLSKQQQQQQIDNSYSNRSAGSTIQREAKIDLRCVLFAVGAVNLVIVLRTASEEKRFQVPLLVSASHC